MPTLADQDILDLATASQKELGRMKFQQIAQTLQSYEVMGKLLKQEKVQFESGIGIQKTVMVDVTSQAEHVGMYETDETNVGDVLKTIDIPWRHTITKYAWERRELLMNGGATRIVELMKVRRADAMISLAELLETAFWNKPTDSTDKLLPFGVPYWVVYNATEGFNGGDPSGFTSGAGNLSSTTYPRWKNYSANYTTLDKNDAIPKLRTAYRKIQFKSPIDIDDYRRGNGQRYRLYCNETSMQDFEDIGESQNENLGRDVASMDDTITFRKNPINWVPKLDANTNNTDPIYMLDLSTFYPVFLKGDFMRETSPEKAANQHNVFVVFVDTTWNILCVDRRRQAILAKA
jgi:hypothetical protein